MEVCIGDKLIRTNKSQTLCGKGVKTAVQPVWVNNDFLTTVNKLYLSVIMNELDITNDGETLANINFTL